MRTRNRVSAVILKDKKILLVTTGKGKYYFTPGGAAEEDESAEEALRRELKEELSVELKSCRPYMTYEHDWTPSGEPEITRGFCYIVEYEHSIVLSNEIIDMIWYSKENIASGKPKVSFGAEKFLLPRLIQDKLI